MSKLYSTPVLFAVYTFCSVAGMVLVKYAAPQLKVAWDSGQAYLYPAAMVCTGAGLYVVGFLVWMFILAREPLTVAYPIAVGLTMLFSTVLAIVLLREHLSLSMALGAMLVLAGITLLARSS
ncbi:MAG TPA: EamA family transporter [Lysobacter sp.]